MRTEKLHGFQVLPEPLGDGTWSVVGYSDVGLAYEVGRELTFTEAQTLRRRCRAERDEYLDKEGIK